MRAAPVALESTWALIDRVGKPSSAYQRMTRPSSLDDASICESARQLKFVTASLWSPSVKTIPPVSASHT